MSTSPIHARPDVTALLEQMRAMRSAAQAQGAVDVAADVAPFHPAGLPAHAEPATPAFSALLGQAIAQVNGLQQASSRMTDGLARGEHDDLIGTMVATQKSSVAFQATVQVRNRLVSAYETIMNMPI